MNSFETPSPHVANEPRRLQIPTFTFHFSRLLSSNQDIKPIKAPQPRASSVENLKSSICTCPLVLISDDDRFEEIYYQALFKNFDDFIKPDAHKQNLSIAKSGEELLKKYCEQKECHCKTTKLVITDYDMGVNGLNGVDTALKLRSSGFTGPILLRTSETKEKLYRNHPHFGKLLQNNIISYVLEKKCPSQTAKQVVKNLLKETEKEINTGFWRVC